MEKDVNGPLGGQVAFVTGGGRGLGRAITGALAQAGADVFITGRTPETLESAIAQIEATGANVGFAVGDVADQAAMAQAVARCEAELGPVDILVNNAGTGAGGPVATADIDEWWRVMEVNVKGPLILSRLVLPGMIERGAGHVVNLGSYQAINPAPMVSSYATSKAALLRLTDSVAAEVIGNGVVVIAVSPGFVRTDMGRTAEAVMRENIPGFTEMTPEYVFEPEAVAGLICRIARGDADVFHGRLLHVRDDLDALLSNKDAVLAENRFALVFNAEV